MEGQGRRNEQTDVGFSSALVMGGPTGPVQRSFRVVLHGLDECRGCPRRDYREPYTHDLRLRIPIIHHTVISVSHQQPP